MEVVEMRKAAHSEPALTTRFFLAFLRQTVLIYETFLRRTSDCSPDIQAENTLQ